MAQNIAVLKIESVREVIGYLECSGFSEEEIQNIAESEGISGCVRYEFRQYNIGEGEGGVDEYFSDRELESIFKRCHYDFEDFEENIEKEYCIDCFSYGSGTVSIESEYEEELECEEYEEEQYAGEKKFYRTFGKCM